MLDFEAVDQILTPWAMRHGLLIGTEFKDTEVRTANVVDDSGGEYVIWLADAADPMGGIEVCVWDKVDPAVTFHAQMDNLDEVLEEAYLFVESQIRQSGHTRTPVT
ncbi:MAG: hypothetical protein KY468_20715 [Armatimonadetes bacterium]|nr:hypothetical protein [Armatimonadota bacterium]